MDNRVVLKIISLGDNKLPITSLLASANIIVEYDQLMIAYLLDDCLTMHISVTPKADTIKLQDSLC